MSSRYRLVSRVLSMFDSEDEAYTGSEYSSHADQPEPVIGKAGSRGPLTATSVWTEQEDPSIDALDEGEERLLQQATRRALTEMGEANQKLRTQLLDLQQLIIAEHEKVEAATQERDNALLKAKQAADPVKEVGRMAFVGANLKALLQVCQLATTIHIACSELRTALTESGYRHARLLGVADSAD
ncbi:hypothetical protein CYMTET_23354 [Cymbomonas tetramitiformis]|uniref:Uncharacterized protein n=1 Tax=Cymbomonas tetramitiformis TaxID=36881 RepID=A0AAE0L109_9CHLO|nr:hypothetical protein CYMTET_23354 [Cymbomonas tetramitiformis]